MTQYKTHYLNKGLRIALAALFALFILPDCYAAGSPIEQADSAYNAGQYDKALTHYRTVLTKQGASAQLWTNIGNAQYRLGNNAQAVLAYERALRLDPSAADARANLDFVNSRIKGLPDSDTSFLSGVHRNIVSKMSPDAWAITAIILFVAILVAIAAYLFASNIAVRKTAFFGGIVIIIFFAYASVIAWSTASAMTDNGYGIVTGQNARLTSAPASNKNADNVVATIPEGAKLCILDSLATPDDPSVGLWYKVSVGENTEAWINASDVERI